MVQFVEKLFNKAFYNSKKKFNFHEKRKHFRARNQDLIKIN